MFKKSKRSFRQRARQSDSDDGDNSNSQNANSDEQTSQSQPESVPEIASPNGDNVEAVSIPSDSTSTTKKASKLSFHHDEDDEEENVFVVKKTVYSRRMERNKKKMLKNGDSTNDTNGHSAKDNSLAKEDITTQMRDIELEKPKLEQNKEDEIVICPGSDDDEVEPLYAEKRPPRSVHQFRNVVERGVIPDAKVIYELKKQRQKLARTINEDFIPVDEEDEGTLRDNTKSRLLREEDDDKSDDAEDDEDENDRIQFGKVDYKTKEREKAKELFRLAQEETIEIEVDSRQKQRPPSDDEYSDDDRRQSEESEQSEDEVDRWEREQIRKAVCLPSLHSFAEAEFQNRFLHDNKQKTLSTTIRHKAHLGEDNHNVVPIEVDDSQARFGSHIPSYISSNVTRAQNENNYNPINERKSELRKRLETSLEEHSQLFDRVSMDLRITSQNIGEYQSKQESFAEDAKFYNETLDFVRNLCECINDKLELIDKHEQTALDLYQSRCASQSEHSRKTVQDQNAMCLQLIIHHKANCAQYQNYAGNSVFDFYDLAGDNDRRDRIVQREEHYRKYSLQQVVDGVSSDDEEQGSSPLASQHHTQLCEIKDQMGQLFEDTADEYATVQGVLAQFESWKQSRLDSYYDSFVGQFIPKFIVYYIRHETLLWNLFDSSDPSVQSDPMELASMQSLILYGALKAEGTDAKQEAKSREADIDIVPSVLDKTLLPRLCTLVERQIWRPLSTRQTARLVRFLTSTLSACPSLVDTSEKLPLLLRLIVLRIEDVIEKDVFIPLTTPPDFFNKNTARTHYESLVIPFVTNFFHRQFWQVVKLMRNIVSFRHLIADQVLKELVLDKLLSRVLVISIPRCSADSDAVLTQVTRLVDLLPDDWCRAPTHPALLKFADLILQLSESAHRPEDIKRSLQALKQRLVP